MVEVREKNRKPDLRVENDMARTAAVNELIKFAVFMNAPKPTLAEC
jgi:hypothetical protein